MSFTEAYPIVDHEDYTLYATKPLEDVVLIHCYVYDWSPSKYKQFLADWDVILEEFKRTDYRKLYCIIPDETPKIGKFAVMFGFEPVSSYGYELEDGTTGTFTKYEFPLEEV